MLILFYNKEQDSLRIYDTEYECWEDMKPTLINFFVTNTSLTELTSWGWEFIGEL
jgi:hypothetical protein